MGHPVYLLRLDDYGYGWYGGMLCFMNFANERNTNISTDLLLRHYSLHVDQQRMSEETIFIGFRNKETVNQMYP